MTQETAIRNPVIEAIVAQAEGLPLYVRHVLEDLRSGHFRFVDLPHKLPRGLSAYYDDLLHRMSIGDLQAVLPPLIVTLAWVRAPLGEETLHLLLERRKVLTNGEEAERLLRRSLVSLQSMIRRRGTGYILYHPRFQEHIQRDEAGLLRQQSELARREFAALARGWRELDPRGEAFRYALAHGTAHLEQESDREGLYSLARNADFLDAQYRLLTDEPLACVQTLRGALTAAIASKDPVSTCAFAVAESERFADSLLEDPLRALRRGTSIRAALIADAMAKPILWRLLIAWELADGGAVSVAEDILTHLPSARYSRVGGEEAWVRLLLLAIAEKGEPSAHASLAYRLLDEEGIGGLITDLLMEGKLAHAHCLATRLQQKRTSIEYLVAVATANARLGDTEKAKNLFASLVEEADAVPDAAMAADCHAMLATACSAVGDATGARQSAQRAILARDRIDEPAQKRVTTRVLATVLAEIGDINAAETEIKSFMGSMAASDQIPQEGEDLSRFWFTLSKTKAKTKDYEGAIRAAELIGQASIKHRQLKIDALLHVEDCQRLVGDLSAARSTIAYVRDSILALPVGFQVEYLSAVARAELNLGNSGDARATLLAARTLTMTKLSLHRAKPLASIASVFHLLSDQHQAILALEAIPRPADRMAAYCQIAKELYCSGDTSSASHFALLAERTRTVKDIRMRDKAGTTALCALLEVLVATGNKENADSLFRDLLSSVQEFASEHLYPFVVTARRTGVSAGEVRTLLSAAFKRYEEPVHAYQHTSYRTILSILLGPKQAFAYGISAFLVTLWVYVVGVLIAPRFSVAILVAVAFNVVCVFPSLESGPDSAPSWTRATGWTILGGAFSAILMLQSALIYLTSRDLQKGVLLLGATLSLFSIGLIGSLWPSWKDFLKIAFSKQTAEWAMVNGCVTAFGAALLLLPGVAMFVFSWSVTNLWQSQSPWYWAGVILGGLTTSFIALALLMDGWDAFADLVRPSSSSTPGETTLGRPWRGNADIWEVVQSYAGPTHGRFLSRERAESICQAVAWAFPRSAGAIADILLRARERPGRRT